MRDRTALFFIFMFLLSCLGQISSDIYLPALPVIQRELGVTVHTIQLTITSFMVGFAISHLINGPISDRSGRRKPLIIGSAIAIIGTLLCRYAGSIDSFLLGRFLQGVGTGAAATLFRTILRDVYSGEKLAKIGSFISISRVILLASAPLIGSYLMHFFGWRSCFTFLLIYSLLCLVGTFFIQETNQYQHLHTHQVKKILNNMWRCLSHRIFLGYTVCIMLAFGGILAWLTSLPILLQEVVGLSPIQFGWICAFAGFFFIVGGLANALLVERLNLDRMIKIGLGVMFVGGIVMLLFGLMGHINVWVIMTPVIIYILGASLIFANAYAGAFHPFAKMAGTAGAVFGFLQIIGGAASSFLMALTKSYNQTPLALLLIGSAAIAFLILTTATRGYVREGDGLEEPFL